MANEIYKANDVQVRQQIKAHLDEADGGIAALGTRVTQNETDITALEAADVVLDGRLDDLEGYRPGFMQYDGSTGYYLLTGLTYSGNVLTAVARFNFAARAGSSSRYIMAANAASGIRFYAVIGDSSFSEADSRDRVKVLCQNTSAVGICRLYSNTVLADGQDHTLFFTFNATTGAASFIIDGVDADNTGAANRIAPTTGTLPTASGTFAVGGFTNGLETTDGLIGFCGYRDAGGLDWTDFMEADGSPKNIDADTVFGGTPLLWNPHGQMHRNLGSAADMTKNGAISLYMQGVESAWTVPDEELDSRVATIESDYTTEAEADARVVAVAGDSLYSKTFVVSIADDAVYALDFGANLLLGNMIISTNQGSSAKGIFSIRAASSSPHCESIASTAITATTGALTGTTGADGAITVSTHTDHKLYIENRRGFTVNFNVTINAVY